MKANLYFLIALTGLCFSAFSQSEYGDGSLRQIGYRYNSWDDVNSVWSGGDSSVNTYNTNGNKIYSFHRSYNTATTVWDPSIIQYWGYSASNKILLQVDSFLNPLNYSFDSKSVYVYDSNDSVQVLTQSNWNTSLSAWQYSYRTQYSYTATGKAYITLTQSFSGANWVNSYRYTYSYNINDQLVSLLAEQWNTGSSTWQNYYKYTYTNDANGNVLVRIVQTWNTGSSIWVNSNRTTYAYNTINYVTSRIDEIWNTGTSSWLNNINETYTYNSLNIISSDLIKWWNTTLSSWKNHSQYTVTFDANNIPTAQINQIWDDVNSVWENDYQYAFTNNNHRYQTFRFIQQWNTTLNTWSNIEQDFYWYESDPLGIVSPYVNDSKVKLYPNPASDNVVVETEFDNPITMDVYIIDANGKMYVNAERNKTDSGVQHLSLSTENLSSGQYSVLIKAGNQNIVKPLLIVRK